jgi:hypothetical protein
MNPYDKYLTSEDHLQIQICHYIRWKYRGAVIHHSPNSGKRTLFEQYKIKALGVSAGFPDILVFYPPKTKIIAVELKAGKNKATEHQKKWIEFLNDIGIRAKVCTGYEETKSFIDEELN